MPRQGPLRLVRDASGALPRAEGRPERPHALPQHHALAAARNRAHAPAVGETSRKRRFRRSGNSKLPATAAEDLLELIMRRYERASTLITSNRPVEDWGKLLGDSAAVSAMLDRLLHHAHVLKCGPRSYRTQRADLAPDEVHG